MSLYYTADHEWVQAPADQDATVGITVHAQDALGDVVFVDLPALGAHFNAGDAAAVVESVKAAADVKMPLSGVITEVNEALRADPALANTAPMDAGWFFKFKPDAPTSREGLMDNAAYEALLKTL